MGTYTLEGSQESSLESYEAPVFVDSDNVLMQIKVWSNTTVPAVLEYIYIHRIPTLHLWCDPINPTSILGPIDI